MANNTNNTELRYSDMNVPDGWTTESNLISFEIGMSSTQRTGYFRALVGNSQNTAQTNYPPYVRVSFLHHIPLSMEAVEANRHRVIFVGRVESAVQRRNNQYGEYLEIYGRCYLHEYADRYIGGDKDPATSLGTRDYWDSAAPFPAGYGGKRSEVIQELALSYRYYRAGPVRHINGFTVETASFAAQTFDMGSDVSQKSVLEIMQMLANDEPWNGGGGFGGDFWIVPWISGSANVVELPLDTATLDQRFIYFRRALYPTDALGALDALNQGLNLNWNSNTWDNRNRPLYLAELDNASGLDIFTRVSAFGLGLDPALWNFTNSSTTDANTELVYNAGNKQYEIKKELSLVFPETVSNTFSQQRAQSFLKNYVNQNASAGQGRVTGKIIFPGPPIFYWPKVAYWTLVWPGFCCYVNYPNFINTYLVSSWVYREPQMLTEMQLVR